MTQLGLFTDAPQEKVRGCMHGISITQPCAKCAKRVEEMRAQFERDVQAGKYDEAGYTQSDRRKACAQRVEEQCAEAARVEAEHHSTKRRIEEERQEQAALLEERMHS